MPLQQVWDDKVHLFGGEAIFAHFYAFTDFARVDADLEHAWMFQVDIRVAGVQFWSTGQVALQNGPVTASPAAAVAALGESLPVIQGEIDDWSAADPAGGTDWTKATTAHFLVASTAEVTLPLSLITGLLGRLGGVAGTILGAAAGLFGTRVRVTIGHTNITIPIHRDSGGTITQIGSATR